jgi:hypothetical protein
MTIGGENYEGSIIPPGSDISRFSRGTHARIPKNQPPTAAFTCGKNWTLNPAAGYISQRCNMAKRNLKIVTQDVPIIGICETCKMQFKSFDFDEAERIVRAQFEEHECKPLEPATTPCPERETLVKTDKRTISG